MTNLEAKLIPKKVSEANSLYTKLAVIFSILVLIIGALILLFGYQSMRDYYQEITQELNKDVAMYMASNYSLSVDNLENTRLELAHIGERSMVLNPSIEVYLLDKEGYILEHNQAESSVLLAKVSVQPIELFLGTSKRFPLRANDPKSLNSDKIFSAFALKNKQRVQGYVYVILGGQLFDDVATSVQSSYVLQTSFSIAVLLILATLILGLLSFRIITSRITKLTDALLTFSCEAPHALSFPSTHGNRIDEIDLLTIHFEKLTGKIEDQFNHLKQADLHRRELVSNVSHDLRTPLAITKGYIETLCIKNNQLTNAQRLQYLHTAQRSVEQLTLLIDDLFELSKLEAGQIELKCEPFSLLELIYDTVQEFEILASKKNITIHIPSPSHNIIVCADIALIQRVFANLIANAIKFTPIKGSVSIGFNVKGQHIEISVSDTGCGIASQDIAHIFERYYFKNSVIKEPLNAAHPLREYSSNNNSSGLGLAIVKKILELHKSQIHVSNLATRGSTFQFHLPISIQ